MSSYWLGIVIPVDKIWSLHKCYSREKKQETAIKLPVFFMKILIITELEDIVLCLRIPLQYSVVADVTVAPDIDRIMC